MGWKGLGQLHGFGRSDDACKTRYLRLKRRSRPDLPMSETEDTRSSPAQAQQPPEDQFDWDQFEAEFPGVVEDMDLDMSVFDPNDPNFMPQYLVEDELPPGARLRRIGALRKPSVKRRNARKSPPANKTRTVRGAKSVQQQVKPGRQRLSGNIRSSSKTKPERGLKGDSTGEAMGTAGRRSTRLRSRPQR